MNDCQIVPWSLDPIQPSLLRWYNKNTKYEYKVAKGHSID